MRQLALTASLLLPLGLDTFALAAALGVAGLETRNRLRVALVFTVFEAGMPILGLLVGNVAARYLGDLAGWAGLVALFIAGIVLARGRAEETEERQLRLLRQARGFAIVDLGLAISVDELTVGLGAGLLAVPIAIAVVWIAVQAFLATQIGLRFGTAMGERLLSRSEKAAGVALIAVALLLLAAKFLQS